MYGEISLMEGVIENFRAARILVSNSVKTKNLKLSPFTLLDLFLERP